MAGDEPPPKLNIGILTPVWARGGVERWALDLIPRIGHHVKIVVLNKDPRYVISDSVEAAKQAGAEVRCCSLSEVNLVLADCNVMIAWGTSYISKEHPPLIFVCHGCTSWNIGLAIKHRPAAARFVAVSNAAQEALAKNGIESMVIPNGVDTARLTPSLSPFYARAKYGLKDEDFVVGFVGRFSEEKHLREIIKAVGTLPPRYKLLLCGAGQQEDELRKLAHDRTIFLPHTYAIGNVLAALDCMVGAADTEGFWLSGCEAAMVGVPLVAPRAGFLQDVPAGLWEEIPPKATPDQIADAIVRVAENPKRAAQLQAEVQRFTADEMARQWKALVEEVASTQPMKRPCNCGKKLQPR